MKHRLVFGVCLLWLMYFSSAIIPKLGRAFRERQASCPCVDNFEGQQVTIKIDGRGAIVNDVHCYTVELKYFSDGRYRFDDFKWYEIE